MRLFESRSFQAKLLTIMVMGLLVMQVATLFAVRVAGRQSLRESVAAELEVASRVFDRVLSARGQKLVDSATLIASDFAFREVIATSDVRTIRSVLANHGHRIDADREFLISLQGDVVVDTLGGRFVGQPFPIESLVELDRAEKGNYGVVTFAGEPYHFVIVPVLAPHPIALVGLGFAIDGSVLEEVSRLTETDISLWSELGGGAAILVSTLPDDRLGAITAFLTDLDPHTREQADSIQFGESVYAALARPVETIDGTTISLMINRSMDEAGRPFRILELEILLLSSIFLVGALAVAVLLARGVSRPLEELAAASQQIEQGDYSAELHIHGKDELGQLSSAFNSMKAGIATRESKMHYQATHDSLTDLPNRTLFLDRLEHGIKRASRSGAHLGMLMMDLDRFREINDTLGHHLGDQLLQELAVRLTQTVRESDTIARLGGDEFAVLVEGSDVTGYEDVARRVQQSLEEFFTLEGISIAVNGSIGIAAYPIHGSDAGTLVKRADVAMYDAKRHGTEIAVYEPERDEHTVRRLAILTALGQATERDELELYYQPKIDIESRRAVHVEALIRWHHPELGPIFPDEFIPQAERSGKIRSITEWVVDRAIRDCAEWNRSGLDLTVAVNVSALDLLDRRILAHVSSRLTEEELPATKLVLEVTESAVMKDSGRAEGVLAELKALGIEIAIDDFGTGYSSLSQLRRLPVGELKIDRSFVMHLHEPASDDAVIVRSTIELGHSLGLAVVAEGVEQQAHWDALERLGCDMAQGYFISRPLPAKELVDWMRTSSWGQGLRLSAQTV